MTISLNRYPSPLRYPGGKGKIANYIKLLLIENDLLGVEYVEPYAGGASVALSLLYEDFASHIHINDLNHGVYAFWRTALDQPDELCARIVDTPVSVDEWKHQRSVQNMPEPTTLDLGFSTFFLNRTNRSGIVHRGGVIGGNDQNGPWKIDARYDKESLCQRIQKVARFRSRITVTQLDASDLVRRLSMQSDIERFLYLDPPYFIKGRRLYDDFYDYADHAKIAELVQKLDFPWVVSYDAVPEIFDLYKSSRSVLYSLVYSAADRYHGSEVMFFSSHIDVPNLASVTGITSSDVGRACLGLLDLRLIHERLGISFLPILLVGADSPGSGRRVKGRRSLPLGLRERAGQRASKKEATTGLAGLLAIVNGCCPGGFERRAQGARRVSPTVS